MESWVPIWNCWLKPLIPLRWPALCVVIPSVLAGGGRCTTAISTSNSVCNGKKRSRCISGIWIRSNWTRVQSASATIALVVPRAPDPPVVAHWSDEAEREWTRTTTNKYLAFVSVRIHWCPLALIGTLPIFHNREETRIHTNNLHPIRVRSRFTSSYASGGAGMIGTAQDYLEALRTRNNPILKPESIELMTTNAFPNIPPPLSDPGWTFGFGFSIHMLGAADC